MQPMASAQTSIVKIENSGCAGARAASNSNNQQIFLNERDCVSLVGRSINPNGGGRIGTGKLPSVRFITKITPNVSGSTLAISGRHYRDGSCRKWLFAIVSVSGSESARLTMKDYLKSRAADVLFVEQNATGCDFLSITITHVVREGSRAANASEGYYA